MILKHGLQTTSLQFRSHEQKKYNIIYNENCDFYKMRNNIFDIRRFLLQNAYKTESDNEDINDLNNAFGKKNNENTNESVYYENKTEELNDKEALKGNKETQKKVVKKSKKDEKDDLSLEKQSTSKPKKNALTAKQSLKNKNKIGDMEGDRVTVDDENVTKVSFTASKGNKKTKNILSRKAKSAKKTRLKNKLVGVVSILENIISKGFPTSIVSSIRKAKLELLDFDVNQQRAILNCVAELNRHELGLMLLLIPKNADELTFLKNIFLTQQYIDLIFKNINTDFVE